MTDHPHSRRPGYWWRALVGVCGGVLIGLSAACGDDTGDAGDVGGGGMTAGGTASGLPATPPGSASPASEAPQPPTPREVTGVVVAGSVGGFDSPWDLRFLPDGTPLVSERPGRVAAIVEGRRRVVAEVPGVVARGEGGLMGLAVDPDFSSNRRIYACFAAGTGDVVTDVRVVRFRLSEGLDALTGATALLTGIPAGAGNRHLGCRLEIGPDGMLWITTGDAVQPRAPQDVRSRAGKVLRATLAGAPAPDNPGGRWDPYVYTVGHRNPQGLAFRPADGAAFSVEHGTGCDDEVNLLAPGANYGWDPVGSDAGYVEGAPMTSPNIEGAVAAVWSSGCPTIAPSGAEFITGPQWGQWAGHLAVAVLKDQELLRIELDQGRATATATYLTGDLGRLRTVRNGPDGSLWVTVDASPGAVVRLGPAD